MVNGFDHGFGFRGQFAEEDGEMGWNSFELRMYDPVIGRWHALDPYAQYPSPSTPSESPERDSET